MFETSSKNFRTQSTTPRAGCAPLRHAMALTTDPVLLVLHQHHSCAGAVGYWLRRNGYRLDIRRPPLGDPLPSDLSKHSGVIVFGGPMSANDETGSVRREINWLEAPLKQNTPFLGICLGAQMLTKVLGGKVQARSDGVVEIGYCDVQPTDAGKKLIREWPQKFFQFHNEGFSLPDGAVALAEGKLFPHNAYQYGAAAFAVQFHPEITELIIRRWSVHGAHMLKKKGAHKVERLLLDHLLYGNRQRAWLLAFMDMWTQLMRPH